MFFFLLPPNLGSTYIFSYLQLFLFIAKGDLGQWHIVKGRRPRSIPRSSRRLVSLLLVCLSHDIIETLFY